jgi:hypothetical protein
MKLLLTTAVYGAILYGSLELQKTDVLLGYTLGVFGILIATVFVIDHLARKYL